MSSAPISVTTVLEVEALSVSYGGHMALAGVSLALGKGETTVMLGANGAGKSTLLKTIAGLLRARPGGRIVFDGRDIGRLEPHAIVELGVALVPEGRGIFGSLSVTENLVMAAREGPDGRMTWTLPRIFELFPRLHARRNNGGHQLSGGEQQMLTIGRALMTNPDMILIDEATEGLAPLVAQDIWRTLGVIRGEGIATVVVDKDFRSLSRIADRMVLLSKGTVVFDGPPTALAAQPELLERHLGV
jgi:branched-chain amino acid transport system ATP-binding protein